MVLPARHKAERLPSRTAGVPRGIMSRLLDLRIAAPGTLESVPSSPFDLVTAFAAHVGREQGRQRAFAGAARLLGKTVPQERVLILECAGSPLVVREAAGIGWGGLRVQFLGKALIALPQLNSWQGKGTEGGRSVGCAVHLHNGRALSDLNAALGSPRPVGSRRRRGDPGVPTARPRTRRPIGGVRRRQDPTASGVDSARIRPSSISPSRIRGSTRG